MTNPMTPTEVGDVAERALRTAFAGTRGEVVAELLGLRWEIRTGERGWKWGARHAASLSCAVPCRTRADALEELVRGAREIARRGRTMEPSFFAAVEAYEREVQS